MFCRPIPGQYSNIIICDLSNYLKNRYQALCIPTQAHFKEAMILFTPIMFKFENSSKNTFDISKIVNEASSFPRKPIISILDIV